MFEDSVNGHVCMLFYISLRWHIRNSKTDENIVLHKWTIHCSSPLKYNLILIYLYVHPRELKLQILLKYIKVFKTRNYLNLLLLINTLASFLCTANLIDLLSYSIIMYWPYDIKLYTILHHNLIMKNITVTNG